MIATETIIDHIKENKNLSVYEEKFNKSQVYKELYKLEMSNRVLAGV